ncbi:MULTISPECIES: light-harvesting antenna LH1, alpha subunit [Halorhodospira]|uniref:Antenna complex, alpha/beta subunit n=1 Tax=Halorhodospira halophila (strain DSM 244 / SL1) TaxID=349124 RepID=A1WWW5_HALHL|nr:MULTISPECIES: light-harvesting antenna LH1, alpha subunit [Halorhodospira]ABM62177.1 antenna complex, alpha/beta subunit [Halorhodospira halophila SL1]MBK1729505.1 light-harvesting protein [Halorhodospira halophila]MBK5936985.1 light-harvesting protein [Halorhodospira halophila]MBK5943729.1 light-harvesting protein [Halorhodospira halophila]MCC3749948.1 light-harvesting protein [Halorhodospira halophila]
MWRLWKLYDPRRVLIGIFSWLAVLALVIHFILLSTDRFNWVGGAAVSSVSESAEEVSALPPRQV